MATYNYSVQLTVQPANGQTEILPEVEAEKVALFVKGVEQLGNSMFGTGDSLVTITLS
jgi:hypothetical protein